MKKFLIFFISLCLSCGLASAQDKQNDTQSQKTRDERKQEFAQMKLRLIAYYTAEVGMTSEEAEAFWPIFDKFQKQRWAINHERHKLMRTHREAKHNDGKEAKQDNSKKQNSKKQSSINYEETNAKLLQLKHQEADLMDEFHKEMSTVLSPEKMYMFYCAEEEFARQMTMRIDNNRQGNRKGGDNQGPRQGQGRPQGGPQGGPQDGPQGEPQD